MRQKLFYLFFLFIFVLIFSLSADEEEALPVEEFLYVDEENNFLQEADFSDEDILLFEELLFGEDPLFLEYPDSDDYFILGEDIFMGGELQPPEAPINNENSLLSDEEFNDYFLFEAPDLIIEVPQFEQRSFDELFPSLLNSHKRIVMSSSGLRSSFERDGFPLLIPNPNSGIDLLNNVMQKNPSHLIEALLLVPYDGRELDMLDIYNALGRIQNIKDQTLPARDGTSFAIFKETTRLESAQRRRAIYDPSPAKMLPFSETMYLRFTDTYIGNLYLQGDMSINRYGITYCMTNFRDISFALFPVMKAQRVSINIYIEPVKEGILIYSMSGIYLPDFIAKRMNLTSNINNRVTVLMNWIKEGLRLQEKTGKES
ncbi:MAG: hypothetical protein FWB89_00425 [Treponema sp.]|nr:hypothetical protein [Treponema sp.]